MNITVLSPSNRIVAPLNVVKIKRRAVTKLFALILVAIGLIVSFIKFSSFSVGPNVKAQEELLISTFKNLKSIMEFISEQTSNLPIGKYGAIVAGSLSVGNNIASFRLPRVKKAVIVSLLGGVAGVAALGTHANTSQVYVLKYLNSILKSIGTIENSGFGQQYFSKAANVVKSITGLGSTKNQVIISIYKYLIGLAFALTMYIGKNITSGMNKQRKLIFASKEKMRYLLASNKNREKAYMRQLKRNNQQILSIRQT
jgi:hypothetical protein